MSVAVDSTLGWYHTWCEPIVLAMIQKDDAAIKQETGAAEAALESSELTGSDEAKLRCQLAYFNFQIVHYKRNHQELDSAIARCEDVLALGEVDSETEGLRARLYLQYRILLDSRKHQILTNHELTNLHNKLPKEERNLEVYSYIANWAFRHKDTEFLELACDIAVFQGKAFCAQWIWQRSRIMLDLLKGTATSGSISKLILSAKLPMHFEAIRNLIWPMVVLRGLDDPELMLQLERTEGSASTNLPRLLEREVKLHSGVPDSSRSSISELQQPRSSGANS